MNTDNQRNWRFRLTLAFQMDKVNSLYTPQQVADNHTQIGKLKIEYLEIEFCLKFLSP